MTGKKIQVALKFIKSEKWVVKSCHKVGDEARISVLNQRW